MENNLHTEFNEFIATNLNEEQRAAVLQKTGVFLICAGAGSGKTRVITARMTNLILNEQVMPASIVALTFTNKAASEMLERMKKFLGNTHRLPYVGTFHSYCLRLLKTYNHLLPIPQFTVLDSSDQEILLKGVLDKYSIHKKITPRFLAATISRIKNDAALLANLHDARLSDPLLQRMYQAYEKEKATAHCFDFDDLLLEVLRLFKTNEEFKQQIQRTVRHILVDEYQDTNHIQHALLKQITLAHDEQHKPFFNAESLCVVGDEDQSIYSWRGATIENIMNFKKDFPETAPIVIEQNYRSVQQILTVANHVISHNTQRNIKNLWSTKKGTNRVHSLLCASHYQESMLLALYGGLLKKTNNLNSLAILYRSHYQSRTLEEALIRNSIPYKIIGGTHFYDRQEVKDLLAYLRLIINPFDRIAFNRAINTPSRGLGDKFIELFSAQWETQPFLTFKDIVQLIITQKLVTPNKLAALTKFLNIFSELELETTAYAIADKLVTLTWYIEYLHTSYEPEEATARADNVRELLNGIKSLEERGITSLSNFLDEVALLQEHSSKTADSSDYVRMMTIHSAKGLEFDTVALVGLEEGIFPSAQAVALPESIEEERRLFYVGITRARERVLITSSTYRHIHGQLHEQKPSRFITNLPAKEVVKQDCTYWNSAHGTQYFEHNFIRATSGAAPKEYQPAEKTDEIPPFVKTNHSNKSTHTIFRKNQPVSHELFGTGIVEQVHEKDNQIMHLTIRFKQGTKKISAGFVKAV